MTPRPRLAALLALATLIGPFAPIPRARADQPVASAVKKAAKHFQRGVALYNEADYRAALVEFRRAYEVAPNAAVLYNVGQAYYQLQHYAQALSTFERYLAEAGDAATHRAEVEQTVDTLRSRVGELELTTSVPGCELTIDDELVGTTPMREPVRVSIGRRKVIAMCAGRAAETRVVEVAAGDQLTVAITLAAEVAPPNLALAAAPPHGAAAAATNWRRIGWTTTAVLAAAATTTGILALVASRDLASERDTYPTSAGTLHDKSTRLRSLSLAADLFGAATLVVGGLTLHYTLTRSRSHELRVSATPRSLELAGTFR